MMGYLVLTVKLGERLVATLPNGERMYLMVATTTPSKARVLIDAPGGVTVNRDSVQQRIDNGESFAVSGHDGPEDTDGPHDAAATDGPCFQVPREGE
jgi:sRNA-binding carbon storage regulator CsrA